MTTKIKAVYGPAMPDEDRTCGATIDFDGVTEILQRVEFGILWFDIITGDKLSRSINARHVAEVLYYESDEL